MPCVCLQGLEDQLLALVVNKERPDLEETKTQLIIQNTEFTIKLKQLEDELLYKLSTAEGDITGGSAHYTPLCLNPRREMMCHSYPQVSLNDSFYYFALQRMCPSLSPWRRRSCLPRRSARRSRRLRKRKSPSTTAVTSTGKLSTATFLAGPRSRGSTLMRFYNPAVPLTCRPVAERGAMLFFLLNSLNKIHAFYQYR